MSSITFSGVEARDLDTFNENTQHLTKSEAFRIFIWAINKDEISFDKLIEWKEKKDKEREDEISKLIEERQERKDNEYNNTSQQK